MFKTFFVILTFIVSINADCSHYQDCASCAAGKKKKIFRVFFYIITMIFVLRISNFRAVEFKFHHTSLLTTHHTFRTFKSLRVFFFFSSFSAKLHLTSFSKTKTAKGWDGQCRWCPRANDGGTSHCHDPASLFDKCDKSELITNPMNCPTGPAPVRIEKKSWKTNSPPPRLIFYFFFFLTRATGSYSRDASQHFDDGHQGSPRETSFRTSNQRCRCRYVCK